MNEQRESLGPQYAEGFGAGHREMATPKRLNRIPDVTPGGPPPIGNRDGVTRDRYLQLTSFAKDFTDLLRQAGVKQEEGCIFRRIAEQMWNECVD